MNSKNNAYLRRMMLLKWFTVFADRVFKSFPRRFQFIIRAIIDRAVPSTRHSLSHVFVCVVSSLKGESTNAAKYSEDENLTMDIASPVFFFFFSWTSSQS